MKLRTLIAGSSSLAVAALAAAALAPVSTQALPRAKPLPPGCVVTVDGGGSTGTLTAPVLKSAALSNDLANPANLQTAGYYVSTTSYPGSSALEASLAFAAPAGACGSIALVSYGVHGGVVDSTPIVTRTISLTGAASPLVVHALVADVPAGNDTDPDGNGPCLGTKLEVRDSNGTVVQTVPTGAPAKGCPTSGGGFTFGG